MTITSKSWSVCARTESSAWPIIALALYAAITTLQVAVLPLKAALPLVDPGIYRLTVAFGGGSRTPPGVTRSRDISATIPTTSVPAPIPHA
jgi:hypothetical protein